VLLWLWLSWGTRLLTSSLRLFVALLQPQNGMRGHSRTALFLLFTYTGTVWYTGAREQLYVQLGLCLLCFEDPQNALLSLDIAPGSPTTCFKFSLHYCFGRTSRRDRQVWPE